MKKQRRKKKPSPKQSVSSEYSARQTPEKKRPNRPTLLTQNSDLLMAAAVASAFVIHLFFTDDYFLGSGTDIVSLQYPVHRFATQWLKQGYLPLWNPHIFGGVPFQAGVHGYLYPGLWTGLLFPAGLDMKVGIAFHLMLAAVGGAFLARSSVKRMLPRAVCGAVFALSGFMMLHLYAGHLVMIMTGAYLPFAAAAVKRVLSGDRRAAIWGMPVIGLMILAGHYQVIFIGFLGLMLWLSLHFALQRPRPESLHINVGMTMVMLAVGIGAAAVQLFPALSNAALSQRPGDNALFSASFSSAPLNLLSYVFPHFFGNKVDAPFVGGWSYWESLGYVGIIPFCLLILAHFVLPWREMVPKSLVIVIALLLSLGSHTPLFEWYLKLVPAADLFRSPGRFCLLISLLAALITGEMLDRLYDETVWQLRRPIANRHWRLLAGIGVAAILPLGLVLWFSSWHASDFSAFWADLSTRRGVLSKGTVDALIGLVEGDMTWATVGAFGGLILLIGVLYRPRFGRIAVWGLALLIGGDLYHFGHRFLTTGKAELFELPAPVSTFLNENDGSNVRFIPPAEGHFPNAGMLMGGQTPGGYDIFMNKRMAQYLNTAAGRPQQRFLSYERVRFASPLIRHLGVRYLLTTSPMRNGRNRYIAGFSGFKPRKQIGAYYIYEDETSVPQAFMVHQVEHISDSDRRLARLNSSTLDVRKTAIVESSTIAARLEAGDGRDDDVRVTSFFPNEVVLDVEAKHAGLLVMSDVMMPGWSAQIDNNDAEMFTVNHVMRGVIIPKGHSKVVMSYLPASVVLGGGVSIFSLLLMLLNGIWYLRRRREVNWTS